MGRKKGRNYFWKWQEKTHTHIFRNTKKTKNVNETQRTN